MVAFWVEVVITSAATVVLRAVADVTCQVIEIRSSIRIHSKLKAKKSPSAKNEGEPDPTSSSGSSTATTTTEGSSDEVNSTKDFKVKEFSYRRVITQVLIELLYINPAMYLSLSIANWSFPGENTLSTAFGKSVVMAVVCPFTIGLGYLVVNEFVRTLDCEAVLRKVRNDGLEIMGFQAIFWFFVDMINFTLLPELWENRVFGLTVGVVYLTFASYIAHREESNRLATVELAEKIQLAFESNSSPSATATAASTAATEKNQ